MKIETKHKVAYSNIIGTLALLYTIFQGCNQQKQLNWHEVRLNKHEKVLNDTSVIIKINK